jgi:CHASE2 domain-containing sensor protein
MSNQKDKRLPRRMFRINSFWISLVLSLAVLITYVLSRPEIGYFPLPEVLEVIEAKTLDLRFHLRGEKKPGNEIVIVAVDEKPKTNLAAGIPPDAAG